MINTTVEEMLAIIGQKELVIMQQQANLVAMNQKIIELQTKLDKFEKPAETAVAEKKEQNNG